MLKLQKTGRGFDLIIFNDEYGNLCSLQESSLATKDCVWFGINDADPQILASDASKLNIETNKTTGRIDYKLPEEVELKTRMHLSRDQVKQLLPHLIRFADSGDIVNNATVTGE